MDRKMLYEEMSGIDRIREEFKSSLVKFCGAVVYQNGYAKKEWLGKRFICMNFQLMDEKVGIDLIVGVDLFPRNNGFDMVVFCRQKCLLDDVVDEDEDHRTFLCGWLNGRGVNYTMPESYFKRPMVACGDVDDVIRVIRRFL